jgi:hypothetical protein
MRGVLADSKRRNDMDWILDILAMEIHYVPIVSILTALMALVCIVPFWAAGMRLNRCRRLRGYRWGITVMMGPPLWYLLEPIWLWLEAEYVPTANLGVLVTLAAMAVYFLATHKPRMEGIEQIRIEDEAAHAV